MGQQSRFVIGGFAAALMGAHLVIGTAAAQDFGGQSTYRSSTIRGGNSGSSYSNNRESINEGFRTTKTWGHDYSRSYSVGGWSEPIFRNGQQVGERGHQWDRENNRMTDWGSLTGTRWNNSRSSWSSGGNERDWLSGRRTFGGRSWGGGFPTGDDE